MIHGLDMKAVLERVRTKAEFSFVTPKDPRLTFHGTWKTSGCGERIGIGKGSRMHWSGTAQEVVLLVERHQWSGEVIVHAPTDEPVTELDQVMNLHSWMPYASVISLGRFTQDTEFTSGIVIVGQSSVALGSELVVHGAFVRTAKTAPAPFDASQFVTVQTAQVDRWMGSIIASGRDPEVVTRQRQKAYLQRWAETAPYLADGARLLDIGCGHFWPGLYHYLKMRRIRYTGLDIDSRVINGNRLSNSEFGSQLFDFVEGANDCLDFPSDHFDMVFSSHALEHSRNLEATFRDITQILKVGGYLFFAVPMGVDRAPEHLWLISPEQWVRLTQAAGLRVRNVHVGDVYPEAGSDLVIVAQRPE